MRQEASPLRREVAVASIPRSGLDITIEANTQERAEIARTFNLLEVEALSGTYHVSAASRGARVRGEVRARVRQICVVSLDPFAADVREPVDIAFSVETGSRELLTPQIDISPDEEDPPEPLRDGKIDLGAVTLEFLALGLDPHPRKPGATFTRDVDDMEKPASPFAVLARHPNGSTPRE